MIDGSDWRSDRASDIIQCSIIMLSMQYIVTSTSLECITVLLIILLLCTLRLNVLFDLSLFSFVVFSCTSIYVYSRPSVNCSVWKNIETGIKFRVCVIYTWPIKLVLTNQLINHLLQLYLSIQNHS